MAVVTPGLTEFQGALKPEDSTYVEEWENVSEQQNFIVKFDRRGDEHYEHIVGPQKFKLTTYERIITQDKVRDKRNDPFQNGCFRPITVPIGVTVETNPNAISDQEIDKLFTFPASKWDEWMHAIDSPATLRRMIKRADSGDVPITLKRYRDIEGKLNELAPESGMRIVQKDQEEFDKMGPVNGTTVPQPGPSSTTGNRARRPTGSTVAR